MEIMQRILDEIAVFKKQIIILILILLAIFGLKTAIPIVMEIRANKTPIVSIEAENDKTYNVNSEIQLSDFQVKATHEDGKQSKVKSSDIKISQTKLSPVGASTTVEVSLADDDSISCDVDVKVKREKIVGFQVGYPNAEDVKAVLYSNGELAFEGTGDVMVFGEGNYPWLEYEEEDDYPVTSVSFEKAVTPTNMDEWFVNCKTLTYISPIPSSVKSMVGTLQGCSALKAAPDWRKCTNLLNINYVCSECTALVETYPIPASVRTARNAFSECVSLEATPDMSGSSDLRSTISMYEGCERLNTVIMPPAAKYIDAMFSDCINLKSMPEISTTVETMADTFAGDTSLVELTSIPESVQELSNCFSDCPYIEGKLTIDCNAKSFGSMFAGSATATNVDLTGKSKLLDAYANTSDSYNITVNEKRPNPNIQSYSDVELETKS